MKKLVLTILFLIIQQVTFAQSPAFTYQGKLTDAGNPANGIYDLTFRLFDLQLPGGTQIGSDVVREDVNVAGGIFTVTLNFGSSPFTTTTGNFLEISVRPGTSTGAFTLLSPRQPITSSPYSVQTLRAASAAVADNANALGGIAASQYVQTNDPRLSDARNPLAGSTNYIQNGTGVQPMSNFNISGNGSVGGILSANQVQASRVSASGVDGVLTNRIDTVLAGGSLSVGGFNTTSVTVGGNSNTTSVQIGGTGTDANFAFNAVELRGNVFASRDLSVFQRLLASNIDARTPGAILIGSGPSPNATAVNIFRPTTVTSDLTVTGTLTANVNASSISGVLAVANGGTGSSTQNFIDLSTNQAVGGNKTFTGVLAGNTVSGNIVTAANGFNIGPDRVFRVTPAFFNTFVGIKAAPDNPTGNSNSLFGNNTGFGLTTGSFNSFFGNRGDDFGTGHLTGTGFSTTTGSFNSFFGHRTGEGNTTGSLNSFYGTGAGFANVGGGSNSFFGHDAGNTNTSGSFNTALGKNSDVSVGGLNFATAIGAEAIVSTSDTIVIGKQSGTYDGLPRPADVVQIPGNLSVSGIITGNGSGLTKLFNIHTFGGAASAVSATGAFVFLGPTVTVSVNGSQRITGNAASSLFSNTTSSVFNMNLCYEPISGGVIMPFSDRSIQGQYFELNQVKTYPVADSTVPLLGTYKVGFCLNFGTFTSSSKVQGWIIVTNN